MGKKSKKIAFSREILFNKAGQFVLKKRFLLRFTNKFFRYISGE
jgi:hypothetical protein